MIKAFITDLDGTLFKDSRDTFLDLSYENEEALEKLKQHNISLFIATGRAITYGEAMLEKYGFTNKIVLGFNGASLVDNNKEIFHYVLEEDLLTSLYHTIIKKQDKIACMQYQTLDAYRIFLDPYCPLAQEFTSLYNKTGIGPTAEYSIKDYHEKKMAIPIPKITVRMYNDKDAEILSNELKELYGSKCFITGSGYQLVEVSHPQSNKGNIIDYLISLGYQKEDIAVIGDAMNDFEMFEKAGIRLAMKPGNTLLQEKADYCVNSVAEGIAICLNNK